jgi:hypothetical protein
MTPSTAVRARTPGARRRSFRPGAAGALALLLVACGGSEPVATTLPALAAEPATWDGRAVIVTGTVRTFPEPRHYWIETSDRDRVELDGGRDLEALVGWTVEVEGTFRYDRSAGRRIRVRRLTAAD